MSTGWAVVALEEVCEFLDRRGLTPEKLGSSFISEGFRVISAKNIKGRSIDITVGEQRFVDESTYQRWMSSPLMVDDVILTSEAPLGEPAYMEQELKWCLGQRLFGVRPNKSKLYGRFLFYAFQASPVRDDMLSRATGATAQGIRQSELRKVKLPLPPLTEQRRIVTILDQAFKAIATARANTEQNRQNAHNLFESYLQEVFNLTETRWAVQPLANLCEPGRVITYGVIKLGDETSNGVPCLRTSNVRWLNIETEGIKRIAAKLSADYSRTILKGGEVLVNVRGTLGGVAVVEPTMAGWNISREVAMVPVDPLRVNPNFLSYLIGSSVSQQWLGGVKKGATYVGINLEDLRLLPVSVPPLDEQMKIVSYLDQRKAETKHLRSLYQRKIDALDELKQSLLYQAFSGKL
ncbi:TPA: restriction endonuclease subunit S [Klebsiella variicola]|nr:restriction endonuclease subunit S [Klebsiella variicola subsp. variicola]HDT4765945.1 restriction endonuclease subunit S [Klebsiella variicola]